MSIKRIALSTTLGLLSQHALAVNNNPVTVEQMNIAINKAVASISPGETYTAGTAISIINNIISGAYTPGAGIGISGAEISATPYTASAGLKLVAGSFDIQGYQAGTNITIDESTTPSTINATGGGTTVTVGQLYQGGIVYYVDATGQHGLAVSLQDQSSASEMGTGSLLFAGTGNGVGAGVINSAMMIVVQGNSGYAGGLVTNSGYESNGTTSCGTPNSSPPVTCFGGWYVGSAYEYQLITPNFDAINTVIVNNGGTAISTSQYWSSTAGSNVTQLYTVNIDTAVVEVENQFDVYRIRGIRQF